MDSITTKQGNRARPPGLFHKLNRTHERDVFVTAALGLFILFAVYLGGRAPNTFGLFLFLILIAPGITLALLIWNLMGMVRLWKSRHFKALIPLALLVAFIASVGPVEDLGFRMRIRSFRKHLPEYERLVEAIRSGAIQHEEGMTVGAYGDNFQFVDFPPRLLHLARGARVWRTPDKGLVVAFLYVPGFGRHISDYVYSSTGDFSEGHLLEGMRVQYMITTNWCASY